MPFKSVEVLTGCDEMDGDGQGKGKGLGFCICWFFFFPSFTSPQPLLGTLSCYKGMTQFSFPLKNTFFTFIFEA